MKRSRQKLAYQIQQVANKLAQREAVQVGQRFVQYLEESADIGWEGLSARDLWAVLALLEDFQRFTEALD